MKRQSPKYGRRQKPRGVLIVVSLHTTVESCSVDEIAQRGQTAFVCWPISAFSIRNLRSRSEDNDTEQ